MITFHRVKFSNMFSFGNVPVEVPLDKYGSSLVTGTNGAGKTSGLLDSICFGLFGKTYRGTSKSQIVNSINQKECMVEIEFSVGNQRYLVKRGIKPNIFEIYHNGKLMDQHADVIEQQKKLEQNILRLNFNTFTQVVILGAGNYIPFMELNAKSRREVVESILDIQVFSTMNKILKQRIASNKEVINKVDYDLDITKEKISMQEKYIAAMEAKSVQLVSELNEKVANNQEEVESLEKKNASIRAKITEKMPQLQAKAKTLGNLNQLNGFKDKFRSSIKKLSAEERFYSENNECPTCNQEIDEDFKKSAIADKSSKRAEVEEALLKIDEEISKVESAIKDVESVEKEIYQLEMEMHKNNASITGIKKHIDELQKEIRDIQSGSSSKGGSSEDKVKLESLQKEFAILKCKEEKILTEQQRCSIMSDILKDDGIKSMIVKRYLPIMNKLINRFLTSMDFYVDFTLDEEFNEVIRSRYRDTFNYKSFSEGEKARINLALLFAWREVARIKNSINTNILILDEVFDGSMDHMGADDLLKIINEELPKTNTFVISHRDHMKDKFDSSMHFTKSGNFSRLDITAS